MSDVIPEPSGRSNNQLINRIRLIRGDLLDQTGIDAIVGSIPPSLKVDDPLNKAIVAAAGEKIDEFIVENIFRPRSGDVFAVPPFNLPVAHILYAVTPIWKDNLANEDRDLTRCYRGVIQLALQMKLRRIALSTLGTELSKYPIKRAARLGVKGIIDRMTVDIDEVRIVCSEQESYDAFDEWLRYHGWTPEL